MFKPFANLKEVLERNEKAFESFMQKTEKCQKPLQLPQKLKAGHG